MTSFYTPCNEASAKCLAKAFWQMQGTPSYDTETILPKGVIELIFSFDGPVPMSRNGRVQVLSTPRCFVSGMSDAPVQLHAPEQQSFFGIELHAAAVKKLLKIPSGNFTNTITDLDLIDKEFNSLWHRLAEAGSFHSRVGIMQQWLHQKSYQLPGQEMAISGFLANNPEPLGVAALATRFCYSVRQLHRKTKEIFGMSTEGLLRYQRYVHALHLMHHSQETLTSIGYDCGYYDQAHFIREFKDFTGLTPGDYRKQKSSLPGHLYQNVRYVQ